jgi:hypothetical protein
MGSCSRVRPMQEIQNLIFTKEILRGFGRRISGIRAPRIWSVLLLTIMILLYIYFE